MGFHPKQSRASHPRTTQDDSGQGRRGAAGGGEGGQPPREIGAVPPAGGPADRNRAWPRGRDDGEAVKMQGRRAWTETDRGRRRQIHNEGADGGPRRPAGGRRGGATPGKERSHGELQRGRRHSGQEQRRGIPPPPAPRGLCPAAHAGGGEGAWWGGGGGVVALGFRPCRPNGSDAGASSGSKKKYSLGT
jgi:hypothetical protein